MEILPAIVQKVLHVPELQGNLLSVSWLIVKCWDSNLIGDEGGRQGGIGVNSNGFLRCRARGASTLDLIVMEFRMGCRQMDLASACVLRPLNRLVLYFKVGGMTE